MVSNIKRRGDKFYLIVEEPECVNVSFWYIPTRLRKLAHTKEREQELGKVYIFLSIFESLKLLKHLTLAIQ